MKYKEIEDKYKDLIEIACDYMNKIKDYEHNISHMEDVVRYSKELLDVLDVDANSDVVILSAYWHDVGRYIKNQGHEEISANMLKEELEKRSYDEDFIQKCYLAIVNHRYDMKPTTIEGLIVKDADKLAWIGKKRWEACLEHKQKIDGIMASLPELRNNFLYFDEARDIFDRDLVLLLEMLYRRIM